MEIPDFVRNDATRCFHCKTDLYSLLGICGEYAGSIVLVDGTNVDDFGDDRPGMKAARQWGVRSPLVEAEFSKADIRKVAKEFGLSNWEKPAAACLSSSIPRGIVITNDIYPALSAPKRCSIVKAFVNIEYGIMETLLGLNWHRMSSFSLMASDRCVPTAPN